MDFDPKKNIEACDKQIIMDFIKIEWDDIHHSRMQQWTALVGIAGAITFLLDKSIRDYKVIIALLGLIFSFMGSFMSWRHHTSFFEKLSHIKSLEEKIGFKYPTKSNWVTVGDIIFLMFGIFCGLFSALAYYFSQKQPPTQPQIQFTKFIGIEVIVQFIIFAVINRGNFQRIKYKNLCYITIIITNVVGFALWMNYFAKNLAVSNWLFILTGAFVVNVPIIITIIRTQNNHEESESNPKVPLEELAATINQLTPTREIYKLNDPEELTFDSWETLQTADGKVLFHNELIHIQYRNKVHDKPRELKDYTLCWSSNPMKATGQISTNDGFLSVPALNCSLTAKEPYLEIQYIPGSIPPKSDTGQYNDRCWTLDLKTIKESLLRSQQKESKNGVKFVAMKPYPNETLLPGNVFYTPSTNEPFPILQSYDITIAAANQMDTQDFHCHKTSIEVIITRDPIDLVYIDHNYKLAAITDFQGIMVVPSYTYHIITIKTMEPVYFIGIRELCAGKDKETVNIYDDILLAKSQAAYSKELE